MSIDVHPQHRDIQHGTATFQIEMFQVHPAFSACRSDSSSAEKGRVTFPLGSLPDPTQAARVPRVQLQQVRKSFGAVRAVEDLSLVIEAGTHHLLTGPSGSGKSTTLRLIAGLESPDAGQIFADGFEITRLPPEKRQCGWVAQSPGLLPHLDLLSQLELPLRFHGVDSKERRIRAEAMADRLGLRDRLQHRPAELSGGEATRTALGRALIGRPGLLLLDEPFAHLDPPLRRQLRGLLRELQREHQFTIIHVTHHPAEMLSDADQLTCLQNGRCVQSGTPDDLYRLPSTLWLADLLGEGPVWRCPIPEFELRGVRLAEPVPVPADARWLGLRPESLSIRRASDGSPGIGPVQITRIARAGPRTWIEVGWSSGNTLEVPVAGAVDDWNVGDTAWLGFTPESCLWFGAER